MKLFTPIALLVVLGVATTFAVLVKATYPPPPPPTDMDVNTDANMDTNMDATNAGSTVSATTIPGKSYILMLKEGTSDERLRQVQQMVVEQYGAELGQELPFINGFSFSVPDGFVAQTTEALKAMDDFLEIEENGTVHIMVDGVNSSQ